jgi:hypothetical protein
VIRSVKVIAGSPAAGDGGKSVPPFSIFLRAFSCATIVAVFPKYSSAPL